MRNSFRKIQSLICETEQFGPLDSRFFFFFLLRNHHCGEECLRKGSISFLSQLHPSNFFLKILFLVPKVSNSWNLRSDVLWKLFDIGFPYKHCNFKPVCLPVKMASKTLIRPIGFRTTTGPDVFLSLSLNSGKHPESPLIQLLFRKVEKTSNDMQRTLDSLVKWTKAMVFVFTAWRIFPRERRGRWSSYS